jgi:hypothetical protein
LGLHRFHHLFIFPKGLTVTYLLLILALFVVSVTLYAVWLRPWLKTKPWADGFFNLIEPVEIALFKKSETVLIGRLIWVGSLFVGAYDAVAVFAQSLDLTPLTTRLFDLAHIPPDMRGLAVTAALVLLGRLITWLRSRTTKPLEVVAVASKDVTPAVAQALITAEVTKQDAVDAVTEAKAA